MNETQIDSASRAGGPGDCEAARKTLEEYLHNELCSEDAADVRAHLAGCDECSAEHHVGVTLTTALQRGCREAAPEELRERLFARLRAARAEHG